MAPFYRKRNTMAGQLENRNIVITGVADPQGIGFGSARVLAQKGALLTLVDISEQVHERRDDLEREGFDVRSHTVDLTNHSDVVDLIDQVVKDAGVIDGLVNLAGIAARAKKGDDVDFEVPILATTSIESWERTLAINLTTQFNCVRAVLPHMIERRYGRIVNFSSVTGPVGAIAGLGAYAAAKAGVVGLTKSIALENGQFGITANAIAPGYVDTAALTPGMHIGGENTPLRRSGEPREIGALVGFLASEESSYVTGQLITIDGGNMIQEYKGPGELVL
ncbi:SDR family NAD(P)-dependent oxidoreductase [Rhodococcus opacus]|uniref:SDR family NAD(P)-dependent oxidoreductase n=1 Tax=Rhodococcus opacus TaxID=37919 RepID=A0AAX3Y8T2_RHOOP|nr:SDR family NAD(P)-dependent oxidoreductase [Rhodococcus opacus]MCZ4588316.1 SDR family NAD(P)-dependent oxidoreductase [Rhodococcus opacus]WLF44439.1 SDR family NAD(P)-dependent oxidoreductase [Rhodococcus opacus]